MCRSSCDYFILMIRRDPVSHDRNHTVHWVGYAIRLLSRLDRQRGDLRPRKREANYLKSNGLIRNTFASETNRPADESYRC